MPSYFEPHTYLKDTSNDPIFKAVNKKFVLKSRVYPAIMTSAGFLILVSQVIYPLISFKTLDDTKGPATETVLGKASGFTEFSFKELLSGSTPVKEPVKTETIGVEVAGDKNVLGSKDEKANVPDRFYLTVPKLRIKDAVVETNSSNLNPEKSLGHYKGTALPGEVGNAFIYGHSVLPWFYNPRNYKTIFSTLDSLKVGDSFTISYNNNELHYKVESVETKKPEEVDPMAEFKPKYLNESTVTLMTCVPPGTRIKRLLVNAVLVD